MADLTDHDLDQRTVAIITASVERILDAPDGERLTTLALDGLDPPELRVVARQLAAGLALLIVQSATSQAVDPYEKLRLLSRTVLGYPEDA